MKLTKENISEWKMRLDELFQEKTQTSIKLSEVNSDVELLYDYKGYSPEEAVEDFYIKDRL